MINIDDLKHGDPEFGLAPLAYIKTHLDRIFGTDAWVEWELETISVELGFIPDSLLQDKIYLLQTLHHIPEAIYEDPMLFLFATEVINNHHVDFDSVPIPNSLELARAVTTFRGEYGGDLKRVVAYLLKEDGYSSLVWPFTNSNADASLLINSPDETHVADMNLKEDANREYVGVVS